jgi:hypothetical protein
MTAQQDGELVTPTNCFSLLFPEGGPHQAAHLAAHLAAHMPPRAGEDDARERTQRKREEDAEEREQEDAPRGVRFLRTS